MKLPCRIKEIVRKNNRFLPTTTTAIISTQINPFHLCVVLSTKIVFFSNYVSSR